ncbi:MAG: DUF3604 domain-containing protein [Haliea sp.]|jgi:hypothetical protein|nr:DUF3604 domain-containing protein [Haliea sp.]
MNLKLIVPALAMALSPVGVGKDYSPDEPRRLLFGDTHHHSSLSVDSGLIGNRLGPDVSFRLARGEEVTTNSGQRAKLVRPLDFLVISDHAEYLGIADLLNDGNPALLATEVGQEWYKAMQVGGKAAWDTAVDITAEFSSGEPRFRDTEVERSVWHRVVDIASEYNQPGTFTTFNGYEYSSTVNGDNLHRVVIFRDGPERVKQVIPFGAFDSQDPEGLWDYMAGYEEKTGGRILAIPHNPNISNGAMFSETVNGSAMTRDYAERRARWEPLMEVTQMKGDSETHPLLSPEDEFADFETWDVSNVAGTPKEDWMLEHEYARSALKLGMRLEQEVGANPFKFGMIGSSDTHTSLSTTREENYFGKLPHLEPSAKRAGEVMLRHPKTEATLVSAWETGASGLAAVWAQENTREAIFDAMARKEVYATTGTRISVRVFAGWDFDQASVERQDFAALGYRHGVPMGGELESAPSSKSPVLIVQALRDADGANLDRVQIIKGWVDQDGGTHERVFDIAVSDGRSIDPDGRCRTPVGDTVNIVDASYTNAIGATQLVARWIDPEFDPAQRAFYYVRVLEIPTPRWTAYDARRFGAEVPEDARMTVQERAYTSPIWYTP